MLSRIKKRLSSALVILLIASQFAFVGTYLFTPKPAEAFWGVGDFTFNTEVANWYDIFKEIGIGVAQRIAISYANKYLSRFVDKTIDKYRIKDYLAYDKVLSGYYLNQFIYKNVDDPDLRAIYGILATDINTRATVTTPSGQTMPVLAALKQKLDQFYYNQGGINPSLIYNPGSAMRDEEYFAMAQAYFANPPSFSDQQLYGQFGQMVTDSQKAASLEIAASPGLKNDRSTPTDVVPHICDFNGPLAPGVANPRDSEQACLAVGGNWRVDSSGLLSSAIQNPSAFIHDFATGAINSIFTSNFGVRDNIYTTIGSLLGSYIFNKLTLDKSGGTFNESGSSYTATNGNVPMVKNVDVDGDNIPDGQDGNGDGRLVTRTEDVCYHGGTAPNCVNSTNAVTSPYFTPICQSIDRAVTSLTEFSRFINTYANQLQDNDNFKNKADADVWARRAGEVDSAMENIINSIQSYHSSYFDNTEFAVSRFGVFISAVLQSLQKDKDLDLARFGSGGGGFDNLKKNTNDTLVYLVEVKRVIGKCEDPNLRAVSQVVPPIIQDPGTGTGGNFPTCADFPTATACTVPNHTSLVAQVKSYLIQQGQQFNTYCDAFEIVRRVAWVLRSEGGGLLTTFHTTRCNGFSADIVAYPDNSGADILTSAGPPGNVNGPAWQAFPPPTTPEAGVNYQPPTDPGDPPDACYLTNSCP